jgi:hypothetical protein
MMTLRDMKLITITLISVAALIGALLFVMPGSAADTAVKDMTESTSPAITDIMYLIGDPGGTPVDRKITVGAITQIQTVVNSASGTVNITDAQARAGTFFVNTYAGTTTFNLPTAAANRSVCVRNGQGNAQVLRFDLTTGTNYLVKPTGARTSAAGEYYGCTADAGNQMCAVAFGTGDWYITSEKGTCAEE